MHRRDSNEKVNWNFGERRWHDSIEEDGQWRWIESDGLRLPRLETGRMFSCRRQATRQPVVIGFFIFDLDVFKLWWQHLPFRWKEKLDLSGQQLITFAHLAATSRVVTLDRYGKTRSPGGTKPKSGPWSWAGRFDSLWPFSPALRLTRHLWQTLTGVGSRVLANRRWCR